MNNKRIAAPEKSGSFSSREDNKPESDAAPPAPASSTDVDIKLDGQDDIIEENETERKDEKANIEDQSSDLDLNNLSKISEEIDRFIGNLNLFSSAKGDTNSNLPEIPNIVEEFVNLVEVDIRKYDSGNAQDKWYQTTDDDSSLLQAIDRISKLTSALGEIHSESDPKFASLVNRTSNVLQRAMSFLEEEFRTVVDYSGNFDSDPTKTKQVLVCDNERCVLQQPDSAEENQYLPRYSPEVLSLLKIIATSMISSGYETECCQVYSIARQNAFEESLNKLGFEKISFDDVQKMQWVSLEAAIATWINVIKRCVKDYFLEERKVCNEIFSYNSSVSGSLFSNLSRGVVIQLLNFAEAVAMTKRSAEKLFKFLDMYEALRDLIPVMDDLFADESSQELKSEIISARCRLGEAAVGMFCDLENSIKSETGKTPVPGGAVHPLTRYTMNYLKYACEYKDTLEQVFQEHQKIEQQSDVTSTGSDLQTESSNTPRHNNDETAKSCPFSIQLMTVMDLLDSNLQSKSKLYKDLSLSYIFLMNNGRYIMQKIKGSEEIHNLMGDTWRRKRSSDLRQYHKNYQRETWSKVLGCLRFEGLQVNGKVAKPVLKERFKSFNMIFEEIHKTQSTWVVSDEQLQSELRVSISAVVIPAYRAFVAKFHQYLDAGRQTEKYIKYAPDDIETYIDELFDGNPSSMVRRKT